MLNSVEGQTELVMAIEAVRNEDESDVVDGPDSTTQREPEETACKCDSENAPQS
jgi:hypothetical protein